MTKTVDPNQVLSILREYCAQTESKVIEKPELKSQMYSVLGQIIPDFCSQLNEQILNREKNIVYVQSLCYVFGDIHGKVSDVYDYEKMLWLSNDPKANYIFLGDFVDRGKYGVEVSLYLFALKMLSPQQFFLVRGNHELRSTQYNYTFYDECIEKFGKQLGEVIFEAINTSFDRLPLAAVIDNEIFCCHGGVPKGNVTVEDIMRIPKPLVDPDSESELANHILWNDPIESMSTYNKHTEERYAAKQKEFVPNRSRHIGYYFTAAAVKSFLKINSFDYVFRAHECVEDGYRFSSNDRTITVFSSSKYTGLNNTTACLRVSSDKIQVILLKKGSKSKRSLSQESNG